MNATNKMIVKVAVGFFLICLTLLFFCHEAKAERPGSPILPDFPDVARDHWAYIHIMRLTFDEAVNGFPDGTFGPARNITRAEFMAIVVGALLGRPPKPPAEQHWATNIMAEAEKYNLLEAGEFAPDTWGKAINRQEMAKVMALGNQYVRKEALADNTLAFTSKVADFASIPEAYRPYVAQVYAKGIVAGYPDSTFGGEKPATRAEAVTMIARLISSVYRLGDGTISFDAKVDVHADGRMTLEKSEEYMMKTLQSLKFYQEDGVFYFAGQVENVPEGFINSLTIRVAYDDVPGSNGLNYSSTPNYAQEPLPESGPFKVELAGVKRREQIHDVLITFFVYSRNSTNETYDRYPYEVVWNVNNRFDSEIMVYDYITYELRHRKYYDFSKIFMW